jgi:hypothetical protein
MVNQPAGMQVTLGVGVGVWVCGCIGVYIVSDRYHSSHGQLTLSY